MRNIDDLLIQMLGSRSCDVVVGHDDDCPVLRGSTECTCEEIDVEVIAISGDSIETEH